MTRHELQQERAWSIGLGAACLLVAGLTLGPVAFPRPNVPTITRVALPAVQSASAPAATSASAEPPTYPTTASVTPLISGRLNLNTATEEQLEALPQVGPALAKRLIEGRPYHSLADLDAVKGVGPAAMQRLSPLVTF